MRAAARLSGLPKVSFGMSMRRLVNHSNARSNGSLAACTQEVRRSSASTQEDETSCDADSSTRNLPAQVTTGRKINWS